MMESAKNSGGEIPTNPPLFTPPTLPVDYDDTEDAEFWPYIGNLTRLFGRAMIGPYKRLLGEGRVGLTEEEVDIMADKTRKGLRNVAGFFGDLADPTRIRTGLRIAQMGAGIRDTYNGIFEAVRTEGGLGRMAKGMLEAIIEPPLTALSTEKIVDGEIVPASAEEMATGGLGTMALPLSAGVYTRIARAIPAATRVGTGLSRTGVLARNIGREYVAQASAGIIQEGVTKPDEAGVEMVMANLTNPLVLVTSGLGGGATTYFRNKSANREWTIDNRIINEDVTVAVPSAKQVAVTAQTPIKQVLASVDALSVADNWIEAGVAKLKKAGEGTFRIVGATVEELGEIYKRYAGEARPIKPAKIEGLPISSRSKGGINIFFTSPFDHLIARTAPENFGQIAKKYGFSVDDLKKMRGEIDLAVRTAPLSESVVGGNMFKAKLIPDTPLPLALPRPRLYIAKSGEGLMSMVPLDKVQIDTYTRSGFLPKEQVVWKGIQGVVEKVTKSDGIVIRLKNGTLRSAKADELSKIMDGTQTVWNKREYTFSLVEEFSNFIRNKTETFSSLIHQFVAKKGWDVAGDLGSFENFIYRAIEAEAGLSGDRIGPLTPELKKVTDLLEKEAGAARTILLNKLDGLGYRTEKSGTGWRIYDAEGKTIGNFSNLNEVLDFARSDFYNPNIPELNITSMPLDAAPSVNPGAGTIGRRFAGWVREKKLAWGTVIRRADRYVMDVAELAGVPELGASIAYNMDRMMNGIDTFIAGPAKRLMLMGENLTRLSEKVSPAIREQVTIAMEQMSLKEAAGQLNKGELLVANILFEKFQKAGGVERVKRLYQKYIGGIPADSGLLPIEIDAINTLHNAIREGTIADSRMLRYIDVLDSGVDMTADQYISTLDWDVNARNLYASARKFFDEGASLFGIEGKITGYTPWIQRWRGIENLYNKVIKDSEFIHELNRIGITPDDVKVMDINELAYRYAKAGIHHKSPVAGGGTSGEMLSRINSEIRELSELGVNVSGIQEWVNNFRGIPTPEASNAMKFSQHFSKTFDQNMKGSKIETIMDAETLLKLGFRPLLAVRDMVSSFSLGSMLGIDAAFNIMRITDDKMKRIKALIDEGQLPQGSVDAMLARTSRSVLSKATDVGMKASFQPQVYKVIAGNTYIYTFDRTLEMFRKANGDAKIFIEEMGDLLDNNPRAIQKHFLDMAVRDPIEAAKYLATQNAYNIANRFGRLNNPLGWQGKIGRIFGQFGSWSLNALTVLMEGIGNSRSPAAARAKIARLGIIGGSTLVAGYAAGLNLHNWVINPLNLLPSQGPLADEYNEISRAMGLILSPDEGQRTYGRRLLEGTGAMITPLVLKDLYDASVIWENEANGYKALAKASGFKLLEQ